MRIGTKLLSLATASVAAALVLAGGCGNNKPATTDTKGPATTQPGATTKPGTPAATPAPKPGETPKTDPKAAPKPAEPPKAEPPKAEPPKAEPPKVDEKAAKLQKAKEALDKAEAYWAKNPKDFAGAKKQFEEAKAAAAGTDLEKKCADGIAKVQAEKDKADKAAQETKAKADQEAKTKAEKAAKEALEVADAYAVVNPKDFDGCIKKYEAVKAAAPGSEHARKADDGIKKVQAAREARAKAPKPITDSLGKAAEVKDAAEAWSKAEAAEKDKAKPERERLAAALPYYLAVVSWKDAEGARDEKASAAALRIAEIVKGQAQDEDEMFSAGKFYMAAAFLDLGSDSWEKAEKPFVGAGRGADYAAQLKMLAKNAAARGALLSADPEKESKAQGEKLKKFSAEVSKRADELAAKYAAPAK